VDQLVVQGQSNVVVAGDVTGLTLEGQANRVQSSAAGAVTVRGDGNTVAVAGAIGTLEITGRTTSLRLPASGRRSSAATAIPFLDSPVATGQQHGSRHRAQQQHRIDVLPVAADPEVDGADRGVTPGIHPAHVPPASTASPIATCAVTGSSVVTSPRRGRR
jgi:hypothetical protein